MIDSFHFKKVHKLFANRVFFVCKFCILLIWTNYIASYHFAQFFSYNFANYCSRHFVEILRIVVLGNFFLEIENLSSVYSTFSPRQRILIRIRSVSLYNINPDTNAWLYHIRSVKGKQLKKKFVLEQTWNMSKILHSQIFRLKILHRKSA